MSDIIGCVINGQSDAIFVLKKCKIFLNIVSEDENIRMLASEGEQFLSIKIPNFIVIGLRFIARIFTFILRTEQALKVSVAIITKSFPLRPINESILILINVQNFFKLKSMRIVQIIFFESQYSSQYKSDMKLFKFIIYVFCVNLFVDLFCIIKTFLYKKLRKEKFSSKLSFDLSFIMKQQQFQIFQNGIQSFQLQNEQKNIGEGQISDENKSSFVNLNKTLNSLQNDTLKRYNTDSNESLKKQKHTAFKPRSQIKVSYRNQFYPAMDQKFIPEPWNDEVQPFYSQKVYLLTEINDKSKTGNNLSKSFHVSLNKADRGNSKHRCFRSTSFIESFNKSEQKREEKYNASHYDYHENYNVISQNFNYTNQQKARVTLDHLVHEKKQKKISKILKMKTHCFDKTLFKQENIHQQSKFLIQALQKLTTDNLLRKSIDRAVDVLKKRTNISFKSQQKSHLNNSPLQENAPNWISCRKIQTVYEPKDKNSNQKGAGFSLKKVQYSLQTFKPQKALAEKQKSRIMFKPKRNWIVQTKKTQNSPQVKRRLSIHKDVNANANTTREKKSNNFLQINPLKV